MILLRCYIHPDFHWISVEASDIDIFTILSQALRDVFFEHSTLNLDRNIRDTILISMQPCPENL